MASQADIEATYDDLDEFWRITFGENADITGAFFDGDYSQTLDRAQRAKHAYILESLRFHPGHVVLDIGCGWGGFLKEVSERGGRCIGLTLSPRQAAACRRNGLDVHLRDWKVITADTFGGFDGVASVGAFEHFCSQEEYLAGEQEQIYSRFFRLCADLLPERGRLYVQTMVWDKRVPDATRISVDAPWGSDEHILGLLRTFYPGSWLPSGLAQLEKTSAPYFSIVSAKNGRLDYIETMTRWGVEARKFRLATLFAAARVAPRILARSNWVHRLQSMWYGCNQQCFERQIMDHERVVLEKHPAASD